MQHSTQLTVTRGHVSTIIMRIILAAISLINRDHGRKISFKTFQVLVQPRPQRVCVVHSVGRHTTMRICNGSITRYTWSIASIHTVIISLVEFDLNLTP